VDDGGSGGVDTVAAAPRVAGRAVAAAAANDDDDDVDAGSVGGARVGRLSTSLSAPRSAPLHTHTHTSARERLLRREQKSKGTRHRMREMSRLGYCTCILGLYIDKRARAREHVAC